MQIPLAFILVRTPTVRRGVIPVLTIIKKQPAQLLAGYSQNIHTMKKQIIIGAALLFSTGLMAQNRNFENQDPETRAERTVSRLNNQMELTDDEKEQLKALHVDFFQKQSELREEKNESMREVLGDERYSKLRENQQERRQTMRETRKEKRGKMRQRRQKHQDADE